jgi:hypothetical protein
VGAAHLIGVLGRGDRRASAAFETPGTRGIKVEQGIEIVASDSNELNHLRSFDLRPASS